MKMRRIMTCAATVAFCLFARVDFAADGLQKEAQEFAKTNSALMLAVANGQVVREALTAANARQPGVSRAVAMDTLNRLVEQDVVVAGSVADVSRPVLSRAKHKVKLTIGLVSGSPINIDCLVPEESKTIANLLPGRAVAFRGMVSQKWQAAKSLVGDDSLTLGGAVLFPRKEYDTLVTYLPHVEQLLPGDRVMLPRPFAEMEISERRRVCEMARCAVSAYPEKPIPAGYCAMSREDWIAVAGNCGFGAELYTDDGYFVLGNGLRGRFLVKSFPRRTVIAWSGCDFGTKGDPSRGVSDFEAAAKHLLDGNDKQQFEQAATICRSILAGRKGEVWIVGHSLGGSLTSYVALSLGENTDRLHFASFNGLGVATAIAEKLSPDAKCHASQSMVDIYCDQDPIRLVENATRHPLFGGTRFCSVHFGRPYYLTYADYANDSALEDQTLLRAHRIDDLIVELDAATPPLVTEAGWTWIWAMSGGVVLLVLAIVIVVLIRKR